MKAVAYFRVSTAGQGRSGLGLEAQRSAVQDLARQRGLDLLAEFTEVESGKLNDRPQLTKALAHARLTGAVVVIAKLDRLSRNAAFLLALRDSGVRFIAADLPDANDLTIGVLAVVAQAEREATSRRTKEALAAVRSRLAACGHHTSHRSGRTINRLGNPNGARALRLSNRGNSPAHKAASMKARKRAEALTEIVSELQDAGITTLPSLASALNQRGILSGRGGRWHASTVRSLLGRLAKEAT
jgi:hypothetical protein